MQVFRSRPDDVLRALMSEAVAAADPLVCVPPVLPPPPAAGRTCIVAIGKAAAGMALAARQTYGPGTGGLVVVPHGLAVDRAALGPGFELIHAGHPVPDAASARAGRRALELASGLSGGDRLLALISGGGSALAEVPVPGVTLEAIGTVTADLLASGAPIGAINAIRRALSAFKGGGLAAAAAPAEVVTCLISDVPGDDPGAVASGPTLPAAVDHAACRRLLLERSVTCPATIRAALSGSAGHPHRPPAGRAVPARPAGPVIVAASGATALAAAARAAARHGIRVIDLGDRIEGDAATLARDHGAQALELARAGPNPCLILSGGEASVRLARPPLPGARGGRNLHYLLALAITLDGARGVSAIACDSDGIDGTSPAAGAMIGPHTLHRAHALGLSPQASLASHDSHGLFGRLGDLVFTGPTGTNVNDIRAILITPA